MRQSHRDAPRQNGDGRSIPQGLAPSLGQAPGKNAPRFSERADGCPHCRRFREERDEAVEALRQAREADADARLKAKLMARFRLSPTEALILAALAAAGGGGRGHDYLWEIAQTHSHDGSAPSREIVKVYVNRLRGKLAPDDLTIETLWGDGYRLPAAGKQKLKQILEAME